MSHFVKKIKKLEKPWSQFFAPCGIDFRCQRQFTWCSFALPLIWAYLQSGRTLCFQKNRLFLEKTYKNLIFENFRTRFLENQWTDFYSEYSFGMRRSRAWFWNQFWRQIQNFKILQSDWSKNFEIFSWKFFFENIWKTLAILDFA